MIGTIGGGCVEAEVWNAAREVIQTEQPRRLTFNLGQDAAYDNGLICGGNWMSSWNPCCPFRTLLFSAPAIFPKVSPRWPPWPDSPPSWWTTREFRNRERFPEAVAVHAGEYEEVFRN